MSNPFASAKFRAAWYALFGAVMLILTVYDLITETQAAAWLGFVGAGTAFLALFNTPWRTKVVTDDGEDA